jgi:hypothetical protein
MASAGASGARTQGALMAAPRIPGRGSEGARSPVMTGAPSRERRRFGRLFRLRTMRRAVYGAAGVVLIGAGAASLIATPAQAASPWWTLTSSTRPSILRPGQAADEVQTLTVSATSGSIVLSTGAEAALLPFDAPHQEVQEKLEALFGVGTVEVPSGEGNEAGDDPYPITFVGELADQPVAPLTVFPDELAGGRAEATLTETTRGRPDGYVVLTATDVGDAPVGGQENPVKIIDQLPSALHAIGIEGIAANGAAPLPCVLNTLTCTFSGSLANFHALEVRIAVLAAASAGSNRVSISGGGAPAASIPQSLTIADSPTPFGFERYGIASEEVGGTPDPQAGSHPFQQTTTLQLNTVLDHSGNPAAAASPKDLSLRWPPGLIGNPTAVPRCSLVQFLRFSGIDPVNECSAQSAVGVAVATIAEPVGSVGTKNAFTFTAPVFNLEPGPGEPARFGFVVPGSPVIIDAAVRNGEDYGVNLHVQNITQTAGLLSSTVTIWGVPGDPRHDGSRGYGCIFGGSACGPSESLHPPAFLQLPTECTGAPLQTTVTGDSWLEPGILTPPLGEPMLPINGCSRLPFAPTIAAEPTSNAATSPTGLKFDIDVNDDGLTNGSGLVQSQIKKAVVTLPQGFTTNPSVAEGLKACSLAEYESTTVGSGGCTQESKVGDVEIESPLVEQKVLGSLFVAKQGENPNGTPQNPRGNLLTVYMVARNPEIGIMVKQALRVTPDPVTGQLTTEVDNVPQLPFSRFHLEFRTGQRAPLITPPTCGPYTVKALLYPYARPNTPTENESSFQITQGPEGTPCPSGVPPFHPGLEAGTINNAGGTYSPFYTHITRKDSEQEITRFSIKLPTGVIARLKGVSECSDAAIAQAKSREVEGGGTVEQEHPSCPANSEVGHSLVGSGVGNVLAYAPGKLYLAGRYHGSPISLVSITAAKVGPFDLGTVVVRFALDVNHETAEVSVDGANSDPIPHIVDGIPIHLRDLRAYVDRSNFTLNPTSCAKKSTASTILGSGLNFVSSADDVPVTVSSPFQAADCASLGFKPNLALSLVGKKTHRGALPAFKAVLTYPKGGAYANIAKAQVTLPKSEFLEQGHLKDVCTRKIFETGTNPGENCPAKSIYGHARATTPLLEAPLEGPVYLRTGYGTKLPELAAALNGPQISITLAGKIDSVHTKGSEGSRIRNTFSVVPDAPVEKFTLELKGGKKGLLVNSTDVCKGTHKALAAFTGQNGKLDEYEPALKAQCGKGRKKSGSKKKGKGSKGKGGR